MPRPTSSLLLLAATVLILLGQSSLADSIPWNYATFVFPSFVAPGGPGTPFPNPSFGTGNLGINFYGTFGQTIGPSPILFANWWTSGGLPGDVATFNHQPIQMAIGILDETSNQSGMAVFTGYLDGTVANTGGTLAITYAAPSKTLQLGSNTYEIDLVSMTLAGPPGGGGHIGATGPVQSWAGGAIEAVVQVRNDPEPSTLVLLGVGGSLALILCCCRLRRQAKPTTLV